MEQTEHVRERLFTMRMSVEESERLDAVAKNYGLNAAGVIRMLVKEKHDEITTKARRIGEADAFDRSFAAYRRHCERLGGTPEQPSASSSGWEGAVFVLRNAHGELGRYDFSGPRTKDASKP